MPTINKEKEINKIIIVVEVIKETKIGQGLKFSQRTIGPLWKMLQTLLTELVDIGKSIVRDELVAVLVELRRQNGISLEQYNEINDHDIVNNFT